MPELSEGTVRRVVRAPDPVLSTQGIDVDPADAATLSLVADLLATQLVSPGCVGHAAVVTATRRERGREGCMSVPDFTGDVARARRLVVRGQLPITGEWVEITTDGFEAVALQHEIDHTNGLIFLDRVSGPHGVHPRRSYL